MRWIVSVLTLTTLSIATVCYGEVSPEARAIINAYNEATGGTEAKKAISRIHYQGQWEMPEQGIGGLSHLWIENKKSFAMILDIPGFGIAKTCSSNGMNWTEHPSTGVKSLDESQAQEMAKTSLLFPETEIDEHYKSATVQESSDLETSVLRMIDYNDRVETWIFDKKTAYLIEVKVAIDEGVRGSFTVSSKYGDYREIGGIMLPNSILQITPVFELNIITDQIELNPEIPGHIFEVPSELTSKSKES